MKVSVGRRRHWVRWTLAALLALGLGAGAGLAWAWPRLFPSPLERGRAAYDRGDWKDAAAIAQQALKERPGDPEGLRLLARATGRLGRAESAQAIYERLGPDALRAEDYVIVAKGLERQGHLPEAFRTMQEAVKVEPTHAEALEELTRYHSRMDRLAEAAEFAERLARRPGHEAHAAFLLGLLRHEQSDPAGAVEQLTEALRLDPALEGLPAPPKVRKVIARDLLRLARPDEAETQIRLVLAGGPDPEASWLLSRALLQRGKTDAAADAMKAAGDFPRQSPEAPEPAPYVGSERCAECHGAIHRAQQVSRHARTFFPTDQLTALPLPDGPVADPKAPAVSHAIRREGDRVEWATRADGQVAHALLKYAFGSGDRGVTPVGLDDRGRAREMRLSHYGDISAWDVTTGHFDTPEDATAEGYLGEILNDDALRRCVGCHATDARSSRERIEPLAADHGIGCEKCHGPGGNHLDAIAASFDKPPISDPAIGRPRLARGEQVTALCAQCHSPRGKTADPNEITSVRFQGSTLTWSRCYTESRGALSCTTCHDPHRDAETSPAHYEAKCLACHADSPGAKPDPAIHLADDIRRVPCPVNPTSHCLTCHMPATATAVPHTTFTDHYIRIHRDAKQAE